LKKLAQHCDIRHCRDQGTFRALPAFGLAPFKSQSDGIDLEKRSGCHTALPIDSGQLSSYPRRRILLEKAHISCWTQLKGGLTAINPTSSPEPHGYIADHSSRLLYAN